jgi:hypothetical protein
MNEPIWQILRAGVAIKQVKPPNGTALIWLRIAIIAISKLMTFSTAEQQAAWVQWQEQYGV